MNLRILRRTAIIFQRHDKIAMVVAFFILLYTNPPIFSKNSLATMMLLFSATTTVLFIINHTLQNVIPTFLSYPAGIFGEVFMNCSTCNAFWGFTLAWLTMITSTFFSDKLQNEFNSKVDSLLRDFGVYKLYKKILMLFPH